MIVLDEQLLGRNLEEEIARWYQGAVCFITDLRPNTVIKDDAIPKLLQQENQPTFVTINERDFWRKTALTHDFCVVCFTLPDSRAREIAALLKNLLRHSPFNTKKKRMGKVIRVTEQEVSYYGVDDKKIRTIF
jgi:predicted GTPase